MSLIKLKAKVLLVSEEQMEVEDKYDLGDIAKSKDWEWKNIAIPVDAIVKIVEYNKSKTVVYLYEEEKVLVSEPFEELFSRWQELYERNPYDNSEESSEPETEDESDEQEEDD